MVQDPDRAELGRWAVATLFLANGMIMGGWSAQIPLLLPRREILEGTVGLIILAVGSGAVGAMLFAGRLINRFGSRGMALTFGVLSAPALPLLILAPHLWMTFPLAAYLGAVTGCMDVSMNANSVAVERRLGRAIMSSSHGFWSVGGAIGAIAGAWVIHTWGAEMHVVLVGAASAVLVILASGFMLHDPPHAPEPQADGRRASLFPRTALPYVLGAMALFSMIPEGAVMDWAAIYVNKQLQAPLSVAQLGFSAFSLSMAGMRFLGDRVRDRFGAVRTLQISGLTGAIGLAIAAGAPTDWLAIAGFFVAGLGVANMVPIVFSAAGNQSGLTPGAGIAIATMMGYCGILVAPASIGFIAQNAGFRLTFGTLALLYLVIASQAWRASAADDIRRH